MGNMKLKRSPGGKQVKPAIVILSEGEATEPEYFAYIRERFGIPKERVRIEKANCTHAKGIIDEAVDRKRKNLRDAKRGKDVLIEHWWTVVDTECKPLDLQDAIQKAQANDINLVISDPSIEYWLLLHFRFTTAPYDTPKQIVNELKRYLPTYDEKNKHPDMSLLYPKLANAMQNARRVRENHTKIGEGQPRTDCDLLVESLAAQARPGLCPFSPSCFHPDLLSMNLLTNKSSSLQKERYQR